MNSMHSNTSVLQLYTGSCIPPASDRILCTVDRDQHCWNQDSILNPQAGPGRIVYNINNVDSCRGSNQSLLHFSVSSRIEISGLQVVPGGESNPAHGRFSLENQSPKYDS
jgi:hypothetical protein